MDKKTYGIGVMSITALLLFVACLLPTPQRADGAFAVKDRDYQIITAKSSVGGDTVYVVDNRTGMMAVFGYDIKGRVLRLRQVRPVADAFVQ
jgi:hypothetical protein